MTVPRSKNTNYITDGKYPPEIQQLIDKFGGKIGQAENFANVSLSLFAKIKGGKEPYSDFIKGKVMDALAGKRPAKSPGGQKALPETCPPLLADLIKHAGNKTAASKILGTSDGTLYAVINGKREMPVEWLVRAKAAMGQSLIGAPVEREAEAPASNIPPFVPWDGKRGIYKTKAHGKSKARIIKNVPQPLIDFMAKHSNNVSAAGRAIGMTGGTLFMWMDGEREFTEERQRKVHAAMYGMPTGGSNSMGESFDKYSLGIAICMLKGSNFDRIADIAEILNGRMIFRKNTAAGWIIMYKMAVDDLPKFKKLALRDANEIVCP